MTLQQRHVLAVLALLSISGLFMARLDLSIAIVAMAGEGARDNAASDGGATANKCKREAGGGGGNNGTVVLNSDGGAEFDWDAESRADLLVRWILWGKLVWMKRFVA